MAVGKRYAFTLVELLIVLAIVAILAMVAAPKVIESKVLSTLTQVHKEQRLLQGALDNYYLDYGGYPAEQLRYTWGGFYQLTSPIRYLSKVMGDPFLILTEEYPFGTYYGASGTGKWPCSNGSSVYSFPGASIQWSSSYCIHAYLVVSCGPDHTGGGGVGLFPYEHDMSILHSYSPTNGSESGGDIYRLMGEYRRGAGFLDFQPFALLGSTHPEGTLK